MEASTTETRQITAASADTVRAELEATLVDIAMAIGRLDEPLTAWRAEALMRGVWRGLRTGE